MNVSDDPENDLQNWTMRIYENEVGSQEDVGYTRMGVVSLTDEFIGDYGNNPLLPRLGQASPLLPSVICGDRIEDGSFDTSRGGSTPPVKKEAAIRPSGSSKCSALSASIDTDSKSSPHDE
jgi:hypothetical protein